MGNVRKQEQQLVDLTPDEVRHLLRARAGFEEYAQEIAAVYRDNIDSMRIKGFDPDTIIDEANASQALEAVEREAQAQLAKIQKTRLLHESKSYGGMLAVYDRARSVGRTDANVMRAIARFEAFMKNGRRKKAARPTAPNGG